MMRRVVLLLLVCLFQLSGKALTGNYSRLDASDGLSDNQVVHILQLDDGRMVFTTYGNINLYDGLRFHYIHRSDSNVYKIENYRGAYHVYIGEDDLLWVKDLHRVWCLDVRHERYLESPEIIFRKLGLEEKVLDVFVDSNRQLWLLTQKGLYDPSARKYIPMPSEAGELQDLDVMDHRLFLFFSTGEVWCYSREEDRFIYHKAAYPIQEQSWYGNTSLVVRANGKFYQLRCGTRSVFLMLDPQTAEWQQLMTSSQWLCTLIVPDEENAFISTFNGIWQVGLRNTDCRFHASIRLTDGSWMQAGFNTIFYDRQGGVWLGTTDQGLYYTHPERFKFTSVKELDELGISPQFLESLRARQSLRNTYKGQVYNEVFVDSRGWTWCGTSDGLVLFTSDEAPTQKFYTEDGLTNNYIHAITEDCHRQIWVATSYGLSRVVIDSTTTQITFVNYRDHEGTLKGEYRNQSAVNLPDHRILMGGVDGWTLFHPDSVVYPVQHFSPLLIGLSLHGEPMRIGADSVSCPLHLRQAVPYVRHHEFEYHQNNLAFDFSALNYAWPSRTHYRYRLVHAADSVWYAAHHASAPHLVDEKGNLHLNYPTLSPGNYRLEVMASTDHALWEGPPTVFSFVIRAPWWKTRTAYFLYFLTGFLLVALAVFLYMWQSKRRILRKHKEDILMLRIQHLIERCDSYERQDTANALAAITKEEPPIQPHDSVFLNKAVALVEANMNNPKYNVEQLSKDLCMERSGLYKKLNGLMDKSPSLFIRSIRLKRAANLILEGTMSISEIAEQVGFSSVSYMGKCFQEEYNCKPSEYAQRHKRAEQPLSSEA